MAHLPLSSPYSHVSFRILIAIPSTSSNYEKIEDKYHRLYLVTIIFLYYENNPFKLQKCDCIENLVSQVSYLYFC